MPYDPSTGTFLGEIVTEVVSKKQQRQIARYSQKMRRKPTPAEQALYAICDKIHRRTNGRALYVKQRPFLMAQHVSFIADAYFKKFRLCVEADGNSHTGEAARERDDWRDRLFSEFGIVTLRLSNAEILNDGRAVMEKIVRALAGAPKATPSFSKYIGRCTREYGGYDWWDWKKISAANR